MRCLRQKKTSDGLVRAPRQIGVGFNGPKPGADDHERQDERGEERMTIAPRPSRPVAPQMLDEATPPLPGNDVPRENRHDEWLLDESLRETFPASDPISPAITPETKGG
jgi:hypothetical protein